MLNAKILPHTINPLTAGADYIRFSAFLLAHCLSVFKHVENKS